ncbi:MAG: amidohydrolase [Acidimicrobiia bacterium]|nr:amidohydrolase [Acidimicrobiia bacterium]
MTVIRVDRIHGHPGMDTVEVAEDRVVRIGRARDFPTVTHDRGGHWLLPGLVDNHVHPIGLAAQSNRLDVSDVTDVAELIERLAERAAATTGPIVAVGFDDEKTQAAVMPTADELDSATADRPVVVYRHCTHVASVNHAALAAAGYDRDTPEPEGGRIRRNRDGTPTGVLEETALTPLSQALSGSLDEPDATAVLSVMADLRRRGVVAISAMVAAGSSMWCSGEDELGVIAALGDTSPVRIDVFVICTSPTDLRTAARQLDASGPQVRFAGWKGFADGSLGARTAALRQPYHDDPSTSGLVVADNLDDMAVTAVELGGKAAIHAIGDLAVERALETARRMGVRGSVRIEHASVADPDQVQRMADLGVVASVQPSFVSSDAPWIERRLGPARAAWAYPFASMRDAGVELRGGSDAPIEPPDPLVGIRDAVADRPERLDIGAAVDLYAGEPLVAGGPATFVLVRGEPGSTDAAVAEVWQAGKRTV